MTNSLDLRMHNLPKSLQTKIDKIRNTKTDEGQFVEYCDMLGEYCFGYATEVVTSILEKDPDARRRGTPSHQAMKQTVIDLVDQVIVEQARALASESAVKTAAKAFWKKALLVRKLPKKLEEQGAADLNVALIIADVSMYKFTSLSSDATPEQAKQAKITYQLLARPAHGSA